MARSELRVFMKSSTGTVGKKRIYDVRSVLSHADAQGSDFLLPFIAFPSFLLQHPLKRSCLLAADERRFQLCFVGNCDAERYSNSHGGRIAVPRAVAVSLLLSKFGHLSLEIRRWSEKTKLLKCHDKPILVVDSFLAGLDAAEYAQTLKDSAFFLVLPGIDSVLTHSLYESLYFGCVPILLDSDELDCNWVHLVNCLKYSCFNSFLQVIETAIQLPAETVAELRRNAMTEFDRVFRLDKLADRILNSDSSSLLVRNR
jgi:hypothetical protein